MEHQSTRDLIVEYADNDIECGWLLVWYEGTLFRFPKRALIHYTLGNMPPLRSILPPYTPFSDRGLKMPMDNPFHTDVVLGAGLELDDDVYCAGGALVHALHQAQNLIEDEYEDKISFDFTILANGLDGDHYRGDVMVYDYAPLPENTTSSIHVDCAAVPVSRYDTLRCIVIPHAGIKYDLAARNADVIICEVGGPLAHLALVARNSGKLLIRVNDAVELFPQFSKMQFNLREFTLFPI